MGEWEDIETECGEYRRRRTSVFSTFSGSFASQALSILVLSSLSRVSAGVELTDMEQR